MMVRILVPTDGLPASNWALGLATGLSVERGASLGLLNVIRDMQLPSEPEKMAKVQSIDQARQDVLEFVAEKIIGDVERRAKRKGVKAIRKATGQADPASAISKYAQ